MASVRNGRQRQDQGVRLVSIPKGDEAAEHYANRVIVCVEAGHS